MLAHDLLITLRNSIRHHPSPVSTNTSASVIFLKYISDAFEGLLTPRTGELIELFPNIGMHDCADHAKDLLGRVYEYLGQACVQRAPVSTP